MLKVMEPNQFLKDLSKSKDLEKVSSLKRNGKTVAAYVEISSKKHEELASKLGKVADYLDTSW